MDFNNQDVVQSLAKAVSQSLVGVQQPATAAAPTRGLLPVTHDEPTAEHDEQPVTTSDGEPTEPTAYDDKPTTVDNTNDENAKWSENIPPQPAGRTWLGPVNLSKHEKEGRRRKEVGRKKGGV